MILYLLACSFLAQAMNHEEYVERESISSAAADNYDKGTPLNEHDNYELYKSRGSRRTVSRLLHSNNANKTATRGTVEAYKKTARSKTRQDSSATHCLAVRRTKPCLDTDVHGHPSASRMLTWGRSIYYSEQLKTLELEFDKYAEAYSMRFDLPKLLDSDLVFKDLEIALNTCRDSKEAISSKDAGAIVCNIVKWHVKLIEIRESIMGISLEIYLPHNVAQELRTKVRAAQLQASQLIDRVITRIDRILNKISDFALHIHALKEASGDNDQNGAILTVNASYKRPFPSSQLLCQCVLDPKFSQLFDLIKYDIALESDHQNLDSDCEKSRAIWFEALKTRVLLSKCNNDMNVTYRNYKNAPTKQKEVLKGLRRVSKDVSKTLFEIHNLNLWIHGARSRSDCHTMKDFMMQVSIINESLIEGARALIKKANTLSEKIYAYQESISPDSLENYESDSDNQQWESAFTLRKSKGKRNKAISNTPHGRLALALARSSGLF